MAKDKNQIENNGNKCLARGKIKSLHKNKRLRYENQAFVKIAI